MPIQNLGFIVQYIYGVYPSHILAVLPRPYLTFLSKYHIHLPPHFAKQYQGDNLFKPIRDI